MGATILVIDDDAMQLQMTSDVLSKRYDYEVVTALGGTAAIEHFLLRASPQPDLVLLDLIMPEISGVDVVKAIRRVDANTPIILLSPRDQHGMVMEAIRAGANDCLQKPANIHYLNLTIEKHLQRELMRAELARLERYQRAQFSFDDIIGSSDVMQRCLNQARDAAAQLLPLSIDGPAGSGKELFARVIHGQSAISQSRFVAIDCERPHALLDALLQWGGDADEWPEALGKASDGATILLRHLDALSPEKQEMLAQFLLNAKRHAPMGAEKIRLIATTNEPLAALYRRAAIHEKLYYYFSAQKISVPALCERDDDVVLLAQYYLKRFTATHPFSVRNVDAKAADLLRAKAWDGNVMELTSLMQRAAYYAHEPTLGAHILATLIEQPDMPMVTLVQAAQQQHLPQLPGDYRLLTSVGEVKPFDQVEADIIRFAIEHYRGKMTEVARKLGIGRSTLYRKMQDYNLRDAPVAEVAA
jgi:DNA-binding NtrC family response regulator